MAYPKIKYCENRNLAENQLIVLENADKTTHAFIIYEGSIKEVPLTISEALLTHENIEYGFEYTRENIPQKWLYMYISNGWFLWGKEGQEPKDSDLI